MGENKEVISGESEEDILKKKKKYRRNAIFLLICTFFLSGYAQYNVYVEGEKAIIDQETKYNSTNEKLDATTSKINKALANLIEVEKKATSISRSMENQLLMQQEDLQVQKKTDKNVEQVLNPIFPLSVFMMMDIPFSEKKILSTLAKLEALKEERERDTSLKKEKIRFDVENNLVTGMYFEHPSAIPFIKYNDFVGETAFIVFFKGFKRGWIDFSKPLMAFSINSPNPKMDLYVNFESKIITFKVAIDKLEYHSYSIKNTRISFNELDDYLVGIGLESSFDVKKLNLSLSSTVGKSERYMMTFNSKNLVDLDDTKFFWKKMQGQKY